MRVGGLARRLERLQQRIGPAPAPTNAKRDTAFAAELRATLAAYGIDLDRLARERVAKHGPFLDRHEFWGWLREALHEPHPDAFQAVSDLLARYTRKEKQPAEAD